MQHAILTHAQSHGIDFVPVPIPTVHGKSWAEFDGHFWELSPWLPGAADFFPNQETAKLQAALTALAQFHTSVMDFRGGSLDGIAPSATQRLEILQAQMDVVSKIANALATTSGDDQIAAVGRDILASFHDLQPRVRADLTRAASLSTRLQPAIRDVHRDHILFQGPAVSGIVDFGAMRIDSIAVDIARLLGSTAGDDAVAWTTGLHAYQAVHPLSVTQLELVDIFDRSTTALSGMNWLRWIFAEGRQFEDRSAILDRLTATRNRMRHLLHA